MTYCAFTNIKHKNCTEENTPIHGVHMRLAYHVLDVFEKCINTEILKKTKFGCFTVLAGGLCIDVCHLCSHHMEVSYDRHRDETTGMKKLANEK